MSFDVAGDKREMAKGLLNQFCPYKRNVACRRSHAIEPSYAIPVAAPARRRGAFPRTKCAI